MRTSQTKYRNIFIWFKPWCNGKNIQIYLYTSRKQTEFKYWKILFTFISVETIFSYFFHFIILFTFRMCLNFLYLDFRLVFCSLFSVRWTAFYVAYMYIHDSIDHFSRCVILDIKIIISVFIREINNTFIYLNRQMLHLPIASIYFVFAYIRERKKEEREREKVWYSRCVH